MIGSAAFVIGVVIGLVVGRWWALVAAIAFAAWIWRTMEVEAPSWVLALGYGGIAALGIAGGVVVRSRLRAQS